MRSKELIEAAERRWKQALHELIEYNEEDHDDPDMKSHWEDMLEMSNHILATVRADDDEPVNDKWFSSVFEQCVSQRYEFGTNCIMEIDEENESWYVWSYGDRLGEVKTRGQFRQLCRGLGIELKETT